MRKYHRVLAILLATALPAQAAEERREAGAHEHGHGKLNIAVDGNRVSMELEVPGADIVGFEHEPSTSEQKSAIEQAKATLANALGLFELPPQAGCKLAEAKVSMRGEEEEGGRPHAKGKSSGEEHHSEFHAEYALDCTSPAKLTTIRFTYFDRLAGAQELEVNVVTAKGQTSFEVTREKPAITLGEVG